MLALAARGDSTNTAARTPKKPVSTAKPVTHQTHKTQAHKKVASSSRHKKTSHTASWRRGQQQIRSDRAQEIQEALVREHYLKGQPSGVWDSATQTALQRYQGDHGWQTKIVPDSRALIGLGLGPDDEHLLNPESAMTSAPKGENNSPENGTKKAVTFNGRASDTDASPSVPAAPVESDPPSAVQQ
jgi:hypothetical protein